LNGCLENSVYHTITAVSGGLFPVLVETLMRLLAVLSMIGLGSAVASADDWPHWMGPKRDNVWRETGIVEKFPEGGPKVLWSTPVAGGYAGPAVANGRVFCADYTTKAQLGESNFERKEGTGVERVFALDEKTGKPLWEHKYPVTYTISYPQGPRCTPTVDGDKVYFLGAEGMLICCEVESGKIVWQKDLKKEYNTKSALWGYAAHPLVDGDKLITLAGGQGSHVVALDKATGKEIWKAESNPVTDGQGYVPPSIIEAAGVRQLLVPSPKAVTAIDPETGKRLWSTPYEASNGSIIMTPIRSGDYLFVAGYSNKNMMLKLASDKPGVEVLWQDKKNWAMSPVNVQPFEMNGVVYGFDQSGAAFAVEIPSGKRLWETTDIIGGDKRGSDTAFIVKNGERFFFYTEKGELVIGELSPEGFKEIDRAKILEETGTAFGRKVTWCMPAFANKHMYVRNDKQLICVDLAK
jgi:outer membrane protein assembly factor BamB